jgi:hypothetical protein
MPASLELPIAQVSFDARGHSVKCFGSWQLSEQIKRGSDTALDCGAFIKKFPEKGFKFGRKASAQRIT